MTDGHWAVKWVSKLRLKDIEQEWVLDSKGQDHRRDGSSHVREPALRRVSWTRLTDADGGRWTGIPLYLMVGRVDDEVAHEGPPTTVSWPRPGIRLS